MTIKKGLNRFGQAAIGIIILLSMVMSVARADTDVPNEPAEPAVVGTLPSSVFGVEIGPKIDVAGGLNYITSTYTRYVRGAEIVWKDVEPTKGVYNWSAIDGAVQELKNAMTVGANNPTWVDLVVVVRGTPTWAQKISGYSCGPIAQSEFPAFATFMFNLIGELAKPANNIKVKYWEIWNEPDIAPNPADPDQPWGGCWGDSADPYYGGGYYGEMLKAIYPTIKTKDPNAQVMVGGLLMDCDPLNPPAGKTCTSSKFLEGILRSGAGNSFDGVAFHAFDYAIKSGGLYQLGQYHNPNWPGSAWNQNGPSLKAKARYLKGLLDVYRKQYGYGDKFLMNTELSLLDCEYCTYSNPYPSILETTKSYYIAQAYTAAIAEGLRGAVWFDVRGSWLRNNGLVKLYDTDPAPLELEAYKAYKFAADQTGNQTYGGAQFVSAVNYPGITGYEFSFDPDPISGLNPYHVWVVWSKDGQPHSLTLPYPSPAVYNVLGQQIFGYTENLTVTLQPYYIIMAQDFPRHYLAYVKKPIALTDFINGDFENNLNNWTVVNNGGMPVSLVTSNPLDPRNPYTGRDTSIPIGSASALLGDSNKGYGQPAEGCFFSNVPIGYGAVEQAIYVSPPPAGQKVWLSFDFIMYSQDKGTSSAFDRFEVYVNDGGTNTLVYFIGNIQGPVNPNCTWYRIPSDGQPVDGVTSGWATGKVDLSSYAGKTVTVSFRNYNRIDGWFNTYTYLDEVNMSFGP